MDKNKIRVVELFAGVGGFRLGLEKNDFQIVWSNQWEPSTKKQHASLVYEAKFGKQNHSNQNIEDVSTSKIPDHDLLVGGFPCQDYSVATSLNNSKGLQGKKGVLWWSIYRILKEKSNKPKFLLLENVDRLLKSPSTRRGRDFAIMLQSLNQLDYAVEWRVINAADYGLPQRRKRIFIIAYYKTTSIYQDLSHTDKKEWLLKSGIISGAFPVSSDNSITNIQLEDDLLEITENFNRDKKLSPFQNTGISINGKVHTIKTEPNYDGPKIVLGDILQTEDIDSEFYINDEEIEKWNYLKGAKTIERKSTKGFMYKYSEGSMIFPDALDKPSRTIITGEGGKSPSRFKHVITSENGLRRLTPIELERLNMFPDNHTKLDGITNAKRAFFMGNALVVGVVEKLSAQLEKRIKK